MRTPFLNSAQPALRYLRYVIAAEVAGAWQKLGGNGGRNSESLAALTHLAHLMELSLAQNMETAGTYWQSQAATWARVARERRGPRCDQS